MKTHPNTTMTTTATTATPRLTKAQKVAFSRRFDNDTWGRLCCSVAFLNALDRNLDEAEAVAFSILNPADALAIGGGK